MTPDEIFSRVTTLVREGQALEAQANGDAIVAAIRRYEEASALLRTIAGAPEGVRRDLALIAMNRGNALQRLNDPAPLAEAIRAYDEAIACFRTLPLNDNPDYRHTLGATFMNRGHAEQRGGTAQSFAAAGRSHAEAIALLRTLPLDEQSSFRVNLSAALMNQANVLAALNQPDQAVSSAREAMSVVAPVESENPVAADVSLKARRVLCEAVGRLIYLASTRGEPTGILAEEAIEQVDAALALARLWDARGIKHFRSIAARLYYFGGEVYAIHLPDFLAEFMLEHIDPEISVGAMGDGEEFHQIASEIFTRALQDLASRRAIFLDTPGTTRLVQRLRDLRAAEARLVELRQRHLSPVEARAPVA